MEVYLKESATLFALDVNRVVKGERGTYVEFTKNQILPHLVSKFTGKRWSEDQVKGDESFYYYWLVPENASMYGNTKVYFQLKTVGYADYRVGMYYVTVNAFRDFEE